MTVVDQRDTDRPIPFPDRRVQPQRRIGDPAPGVVDTPATAAGRLLLTNAWDRLALGAIECIDVHLRNGWIIADIIDVRFTGAIAEVATVYGVWNHGFALDEVGMVRCVGFGRLRD